MIVVYWWDYIFVVIVWFWKFYYGNNWKLFLGVGWGNWVVKNYLWINVLGFLYYLVIFNYILKWFGLKYKKGNLMRFDEVYIKYMKVVMRNRLKEI